MRVCPCYRLFRLFLLRLIFIQAKVLLTSVFGGSCIKRVISIRRPKYFLFCVAVFLSTLIMFFFLMTSGKDHGLDSPLFLDKVFYDFPAESNGTPTHTFRFPECRIRYYDPFDSQVMPFYANITLDMNCGNSSFAFAEKDGTAVFFNKTALAENIGRNESDFVCKLYSIHREGEGKTDNEYSARFVQNLKTQKFTFSNEFAKIACNSKDGGELYNDFLAFIQEKKEVEARCNKATGAHHTSQRGKERFNVVLVGFDSLSHRNFLRHFSETHNYLKTHFDLLEFHSFTKLGQNTFPSLLPLLTGKMEEEFNVDEGPYDSLPFIWKNFSSHGYRTMFAEDDPDISILNFEREGLYFQPTDYYLRPLYLAIQEAEYKPIERQLYSKKFYLFEILKLTASFVSTRNEHCVNGRLHLSIVHQWLQDFMSYFSNRPVFALTFVTRLTHNSLNNAGYADKPMLEFFRWYKEFSARKNTFLVFFSDHGMRYGPFRETEMGTDEDILPLLLIIPPTYLSRRYPEIYGNLQKNQRRLVTMFDMHETLKDILNFRGSRNPKTASFHRGISLFNEVPMDRACSDAEIKPEFCPCQERKQLQVKFTVILRLAKLLLDEINRITQFKREKCSILRLHKIISFRPYTILKPASKTERTKEYTKINIQLVTKPGKGLFEGIVECEEENVTNCLLAGSIQRINLYKGQSDCVDNVLLKNYCFCTNS